jgi:hypothetical protein
LVNDKVDKITSNECNCLNHTTIYFTI